MVECRVAMEKHSNRQQTPSLGGGRPLHLERGLPIGDGAGGSRRAPGWACTSLELSTWAGQRNTPFCPYS